MIGFSVQDIMSKDAVTAGRDEQVLSLIEKLLRYDVGAVVIVDGGMAPLGIVTRRDILLHVLDAPQKFTDLKAMDIAEKALITVSPELDAFTAYTLMKKNRVDRLPVVSGGRLQGMITHRDITNILKEKFETLEISHNSLKEKMKNDFLTGVYNRGYMDEELNYYIEAANKTGVTFTLLLIDIDNFKHINDTFGHLCGDMILRGVSKVLVEKSKNVSIVGRYGGDEFMIIVPFSDYNSSAYMAERLRMALEQKSHYYDDREMRITASIGLVEWSQDITNKEEIVRLADNCLYEAKRTGKNRVSVCGQEITGNIADSIQNIGLFNLLTQEK